MSSTEALSTSTPEVLSHVGARVLEHLASDVGARLVRLLDALVDGDEHLAYSIAEALEGDVARWLATIKAGER
jgi:hypothetical protein